MRLCSSYESVQINKGVHSIRVFSGRAGTYEKNNPNVRGLKL